MAETTTPGGLLSLDAASRDRLLKNILKAVSRSFYLTLRVLPKDLRGSIGLAYLLARIADTLTDRRRLAGFTGARLEALVVFRSQLAGPADVGVLRKLGSESIRGDLSPEERALFGSLVDCFALLESLDVSDQEQVRWVVDTLIKGMEMDLASFSGEGSGGLAALATGSDLDRYTYLVAGCVGEFWTKVTVAHTPSLGGWDVAQMSEIGVRFGKALQLTNVLRDIPRDLRTGRCYLPAGELEAAGLSPEDLLDPSNEARAREVLIPWVQTALSYFQAAEEYLLAIPRRSVRLRLACLWPLLLGLATLARLARSGKWLDSESTVKVSRRWVYRMMLMSLPAVCSKTLLRRWVRSLRRQVESAI
jgi:farnesyl-diphosphate farnesyltransferase